MICAHLKLINFWQLLFYVSPHIKVCATSSCASPGHNNITLSCHAVNKRLNSLPSRCPQLKASWPRERAEAGATDRPGEKVNPHAPGAFADFRSRFGDVPIRSSRCLWTAPYQHFNFVPERSFVVGRTTVALPHASSTCERNMTEKTNEARAALVQTRADPLNANGNPEKILNGKW